MRNQEYNGWHNYETWAVSLWMNNEEGSSDHWREQAKDAYINADALSAYARFTGNEIFTREEKAAFTLADALKEHFENDNPLTDASVYSDLLNAALSEVNWNEIAKRYIDEVDKTEVEEIAADED